MPHLAANHLPSSPFTWLPTSHFPTSSTILLVQHHLSQHLPPELVDLILAHAEFWPHTTISTHEYESVRAFGPFTWGWLEGKDRIDYLNVWCPSGPAYTHRWNRWGESRRDDGFLLRSEGIGLLDDEESEGERGRWRSRYFQKSHLLRYLLSLYQKGTAAESRMCHPCQKSKRSSGRETSNGKSPMSRTPAARKIIFETWSHQDYFGAVGDSASAYDDEGGVEHIARVFCDVSINRKQNANPGPYRKGRILRGRRRGNKNNISPRPNNDNDNDAKDNNNNKKSSKHGKLISYKPFILESRETPRSYYPTYHINTWSWDDNTSDHSPFPTPQGFLRQLEIGDTIGVWGRVAKGETYHLIDAMRMHVFWAL